MTKWTNENSDIVRHTTIGKSVQGRDLHAWIIAAKADEMVAGSFFITVTKRLPSLQWDLLETERYKMSWGEANVFLHRKKDDDWQEQQLDAEKRQKEEEEEEERRRIEAQESSEDDDDTENLLVGGDDGSGLLDND